MIGFVTQDIHFHKLLGVDPNGGHVLLIHGIWSCIPDPPSPEIRHVRRFTIPGLKWNMIKCESKHRALEVVLRLRIVSYPITAGLVQCCHATAPTMSHLITQAS